MSFQVPTKHPDDNISQFCQLRHNGNTVGSIRGVKNIYLTDSSSHVHPILFEKIFQSYSQHVGIIDEMVLKPKARKKRFFSKSHDAFMSLSKILLINMLNSLYKQQTRLTFAVSTSIEASCLLRGLGFKIIDINSELSKDQNEAVLMAGLIRPPLLEYSSHLAYNLAKISEEDLYWETEVEQYLSLFEERCLAGRDFHSELSQCFKIAGTNATQLDFTMCTSF